MIVVAALGLTCNELRGPEKTDALFEAFTSQSAKRRREIRSAISFALSLNE